MLYNKFCPSCVLLDEAIMTQKVNLCTVSLGVEGMTCGSCVQSIEQRIGSLPGVIHIKVNESFANVYERCMLSVIQNVFHIVVHKKVQFASINFFHGTFSSLSKTGSDNTTTSALG